VHINLLYILVSGHYMIHMKKPLKTLALLSGAALLASSNLTAETVSTDPVGYVTITVNGTGGAGSSAVSVVGVPLENAIAASGALNSVLGDTLTSNAANWLAGAFASSHYLQVTSGANAGVSVAIAGNDVTTLTTEQDISSLLVGDESYVIRAYTTLADVFGSANEAGIGSGANSTDADELLIYNGTGFDIYYYQEGAPFGGEGWRASVNAFTDASATPLPYGAALIIKRKQDADVFVVVSGSVLATDSFVPVENGVNWVSGANPIEYTLASYFGTDGGSLLSGPNSSEADEILVPKDGGGFDVYYFQEGAAFGGVGYRSSVNAFADASSAVLASVGKGFVLKRKGSAYNQLDETPLD
jgi:uncharacterized protein (TIGR02597 family)